VLLGERVLEAVLAQVAGGADLAAEGVAPAGQVERLDVVGVGLQQDGHLQARQPHAVGHALLVTEVGQDHDHALDVCAAAVEEGGTDLRLTPGLDATELGGGLVDDDGLEVHLFEEREDIRARLGHQRIGEELPVPDDDAQRGS
jgi:hypothetical protein